jgi:hypothetical protein
VHVAPGRLSLRADITELRLHCSPISEATISLRQAAPESRRPASNSSQGSWRIAAMGFPESPKAHRNARLRGHNVERRAVVLSASSGPSSSLRPQREWRFSLSTVVRAQRDPLGVMIWSYERGTGPVLAIHTRSNDGRFESRILWVTAYFTLSA